MKTMIFALLVGSAKLAAAADLNCDLSIKYPNGTGKTLAKINDINHGGYWKGTSAGYEIEISSWNGIFMAVILTDTTSGFSSSTIFSDLKSTILSVGLLSNNKSSGAFLNCKIQ